ncbi:hypothetical protein BDN70DRAFT_890072 [Pholiota conissans]|uniref:Uncharacterized protein n=1 Tax=Pholiota conissans TaxID=109636 RepID=A0A9P5ZF06_9AGAR|nr:hypothetical protein BDN70DRAFT_890072 [Pholiota conissans]
MAELNRIKSSKGKYPAADLVYALLQYNTINVNANPGKPGVPTRDVHTSAEVVVRSNKVYEAILSAMDTLDASSIEALVDNWTLFDNYTNAIPILERILLDLAYSTGKVRVHAPPNTSTDDGVMHIKTWLADREALKLALAALKHDLFKKILGDKSDALLAEHILQRRRDDDSIIKVLQNNIAADPTLTEKDIIQSTGKKLLSEVKALLAELPKKLAQKPGNAISEEVSGVVVRVVMTVYIPFTVISGLKTKIATDEKAAEWDAYLKSEKIWEALKTLLTKVKTYIDTPTADLTKDFEEVEALLLHLSDISVATAKEILDLMKLCAAMYRPYSGRSVALTKTLYRVDQASQTKEKKAFVARRHDIKDALKAAIDHLTKLKEIKYNLQTFDLASSEYTIQKNDHKQLFDKNESLYKTFTLSSAEWTEETTRYATAVETDEKHVKDAQKQIFGASSK